MRSGSQRDVPAKPMHKLQTVEVGEGFDLLKDVRVLDLTNSVAGPAATLLLGDLGARVIKVERPGSGDEARSWGPPFLDDESLWFLSVNRNKESLTLDFSTPDGLAVLDRLVAMVDVVVVNQPPRTARRRGIGADRLRSLKQDLIYVSITGFGLTGPRSDWTCYDLIAEGYSGVMDLTGELDGPPQKIGTPAADMLAGQDAALATVAALYARRLTGEGRVIDISLVNSMTRFLSCRIVPFLGSGELARRSGGRDSVIAIYQTFDTRDEPMTLALGSDTIWQRFWDAAAGGIAPQFAHYDSNAKRREARDEIVAAIQEILLTRRRDEWLTIFAEARVPAGPIYRLDEVTEDRELKEQKLIYGLLNGSRLVPQVGTGFMLDGEPNVPRSAPPQLGEHTGDILRNMLGCTAAEIEQLKSAGII